MTYDMPGNAVIMSTIKFSKLSSNNVNGGQLVSFKTRLPKMSLLNLYY